MLKSLFLISIICLFSYVSTAPAHNTSVEIKVVSYSIWMNNLPKFELPFINNYIHSNLGIPKELNVVMESLGFASLIIFVAIFLVLFVIGYAFGQICLCRKQKNDVCQKYSGRILAILILVTMIISSSVGIFFFSRYYGSLWEGIDNTKNVVHDKKDVVDGLKKTSALFNNSIVNISIMPRIIESISNGTEVFDSYLSSAESEKARALEQWAPVTMFIIIMLISVFGLMSVFFSKRFLFVVVALFVGIMFIFLIVSSVSGSVLTILLSDYCVGGVDNLTRLAIEVMIDDTCSEDAFRYYLFCYWKNNSCNTLFSYYDEINSNIINITEWLDNANYSDPYQNTTIAIYKNQEALLREASFQVGQLSSCSQTKKLYTQTTALFCGTTTPSIVMFSLILELMVGMIFIFLLVVIRFNPKVGTVQDDVDLELEKKERKRAGLRPKRKDLKDKAPTTPPRFCSLQCLTGFVTMIIGWAITVFVFFIIMVVGSSEVWVPRIKIIETY